VLSAVTETKTSAPGCQRPSARSVAPCGSAEPMSTLRPSWAPGRGRRATARRARPEWPWSSAGGCTPRPHGIRPRARHGVMMRNVEINKVRRLSSHVGELIYYERRNTRSKG